MATSLSEQLQRLRAPQTKALHDTRQRSSILFDPKEAAGKDRRTIYDIGCDGLQQLIALNPTLQQFEKTLFDENTLQLERAVERSEVNELLDKNISKFLRYLSPYFLLRPTQMCLEWLIRRFSINEYNRSNLLALALPYHETNVFVRVLQTMQLQKDDGEWSWLRPMQKSGLSVTKTILINRAASTPSFLTYICQSTKDTVREFGSHAHLLQAQLNFYATIVVGVLESANVVREQHILAILPTLLQGLSSSTPDFVSAAYIVTAQLVARTQLTHKLCTSLARRVAAVPFKELQPTAVLVLIAICEKQQAIRTQSLADSFLSLIKTKWLTEILGKLCLQNVDIYPLCAYLMQWSVKAIHEQGAETCALKSFLANLISDVTFPERTAHHLISYFIDLFIVPPAPHSAQPSNSEDNANIIDLGDSDDENDAAKFHDWYANYLHKLQQQYPNAFDQTVKEILKSSTEQSEARRLVLKLALGIRLKSSDDEAINVYESLYHHNTNIRLLAVETLVASVSNTRKHPQSYELLKECLADRLCQEDSEQVVATVLGLPTKVCVDILGATKFRTVLCELLHKTQLDEEQWSVLLPRLITHLTSELVVAQCDTSLMLLTLMPLLLPRINSPTASHHIAQILSSAVVKKIPFLKRLDAQNSAKEYKKQFLQVIAAETDMPSATALLESVQSSEQSVFKLGADFDNFLMILTACLKQQLDAEISLDIFDRVIAYSKDFNFVLVHSRNSHKSQRMNASLSALAGCLNALVTRSSIGDVLDWEKPRAGLNCVLRVAGWLAAQAVSQPNADAKAEWLRVLRCVLQTALKDNEQTQLDFLTNFYVYQHCAVVPQYPLLRVVAFKLLNATIQRKQLPLTMTQVVKVCTALSSPLAVIRLQALQTLREAQPLVAGEPLLHTFIQRLLERSQEIGMDEEQYSLVLYTVLAAPGKGQRSLQSILPAILKLLHGKHGVGASFSTQVLQTMKHINNAEILAELLPLASSMLEQHAVPAADSAVCVLSRPYSEIYEQIVERLDYQTIKPALVDHPEAWKLIERSLQRHDVLLDVQGQLLPLPCLLLNAFDEPLYARMPTSYQIRFVKQIVRTLAAADNDAIFLAASKFLKPCIINCSAYVDILEKMSNSQQLADGKRPGAQSSLQLDGPEWKEGIALLEVIENKKHLMVAHTFIPTLFELLRRCVELEEQAAGIEYAKQLALSSLHHCMQTAQTQDVNLQTACPAAVFRVDQVVECLRATRNPKTQHNALLLLASCASIFPQLVLEHIVAIFTFMGSSVIRHDDAFSFHIINDIIQTIIPILVSAPQHQHMDEDDISDQNCSLVIGVLKVFSDILLDVPEHRRLPLYCKLLHTLGAEGYLWQLLCIIFEAHVMTDDKQKFGRASAPSTEKFAPRIHVAMELCAAFDPTILLQTCIELMSYVKSLPTQKEGTNAAPKSISLKVNASEATLFDVNCRSSKQLRHYKYTIMQFLSTVTCSPTFLHQIATLSESQLLALKPYYQNFIIQTLAYVPDVQEAIEEAEQEFQTKYWKVILHHVHDVLDNAISLLSPDMFLVVVNGLMQHKVLGIRKKVIELLISKLQRRDDYFQDCDPLNFHNLLQPLSATLDGIVERDPEASQSHELLVIQQNSLITLKLLAKMFALEYIDDFKAILAKLTKMLKKRANISKIVMATIILTVVDISCSLKAHSLAYVPQYVPPLIEVLQEQCGTLHQQSPDNICISVIIALQKVVESLPLFLGPYIRDIILVVSGLMSCCAALDKKDQRTQNALKRMSAIWSKLGAEVPLRVLVPNCTKAYERLFATGSFAEIGMLMKLLQEALHHSQAVDIGAMQRELTSLFLCALDFRQLCASELDPSIVVATEDCIIDAFVAWVLKLSESSFRPLYQRVYEWALKPQPTAQTPAVLTFFRLVNKISEALKSLFVLFAGDLIEDTAKQLHNCNTLRQTVEGDLEQLHSQLLEAIMSTLHNVMLYDNKQFMSLQRFELVLQPLVDQLENTLLLESETLQAVAIKCIAQLAVGTSNDILWKQLNYQVLLKTRSTVPEVQIFALKCCVAIARKLEDDFTALLPETVPFIAELFEDENARVEKATRKLVQELEVILGESLQKYL